MRCVPVVELDADADGADVDAEAPAGMDAEAPGVAERSAAVGFAEQPATARTAATLTVTPAPTIFCFLMATPSP